MKIVGSYVLLKLLTSCMKYGVRSLSRSVCLCYDENKGTQDLKIYSHAFSLRFSFCLC